MKRIILSAIFIVCLFAVFTAEIMSENGKAGYTGSPGEATCNTSGCHNSYVLNFTNGSVSATSTMYNWTYDPSTVYSITVKVVKTGSHLFGFGVELLNYSNTNAGTLAVTDPTHTQSMSRTVSGSSRRNIVQKLNGGASQDSAMFTFQWTSPSTPSGNLTMYFVGNATNSNGQPSGDYIYSSSQVITPSSGTSINTIMTADPFSVYPNPASESISLHYNLQKDEIVEVKLYDMRGSLAYLLLKADHPAGENNEIISLPSECRSGLYILSLESSSGRYTRKLMIN